MVGLGSLFLLSFIFMQADTHPSLKAALRLGTAVEAHNKQQKPVVVIIDPYKHYLEFLNQIKNDRDEGDEREGRDEREVEDPEEDAKEDAKYLFYSYLRTSESDPAVEHRKNILRSALRARCNEVQSCQKKCPPKKPSCPASCQEVFDSMNICDPPKKKPKKVTVTYEYECEESNECGGGGGGKYGKTMPPRWRMRH